MKLNRNGLMRRQFGGVLITALIFATIISLFALGVAMVATSHMSRNSAEADYATAIQLADAGINHELRWLGADAPQAGARAHQLHPATGQPGPQTVTLPDGGSFTVAVMNDDGSGPWAPPNALRIRSTGTINGISRTVEITGEKRGLFGEYAVFMVGDDSDTQVGGNRDLGKLGGADSTIIGNLGTNGGVDWTSGDTTKVQGEVTYNGYTPSKAESGPNAWVNPDKVQWPTVSEVAQSMFPQGGLTWLSTHNDNDKVKMFLSTDPDSLLANAVTNSIGTGVLDQQGMTSFTQSQNIQDSPPTGTRYQNGVEGLYRNRVIIFPPGNYYLRGVKLSNSTGEAILIDNTAGTVNIWIDGGNAKDSLDCPVLFTSSDKNKFRLYYNNCNELSIAGNSTFNGSIYAHNDGCSTEVLPSIKIAGNSIIRGSVISNHVWLAGNSVLEFPNNGGGENTGDYVLWYGFMNSWRELNPNGGTLFPDGTSR